MQPVGIELMDAPTVTLGHKEWKIPELAARQNRRILPLIVSSFEGLGDITKLTQAHVDALYDAGYIALTRAYPKLTREQFDDLPVTVEELCTALPIIARQAGMKAVLPGEVKAPALEPEAAPSTTVAA